MVFGSRWMRGLASEIFPSVSPFWGIALLVSRATEHTHSHTVARDEQAVSHVQNTHTQSLEPCTERQDYWITTTAVAPNPGIAAEVEVREGRGPCFYFLFCCFVVPGEPSNPKRWPRTEYPAGGGRRKKKKGKERKEKHLAAAMQMPRAAAQPCQKERVLDSSGPRLSLGPSNALLMLKMHVRASRFS